MAIRGHSKHDHESMKDHSGPWFCLCSPSYGSKSVLIENWLFGSNEGIVCGIVTLKPRAASMAPHSAKGNHVGYAPLSPLPPAAWPCVVGHIVAWQQLFACLLGAKGSRVCAICLFSNVGHGLLINNHWLQIGGHSNSSMQTWVWLQLRAVLPDRVLAIACGVGC